jgi:uncharacterized protein (TIGR03118 family)
MKARFVVLFALVVFLSTFASADFLQTNLVSDGSVAALHTDAQLINPWGIAFSGTSPFWIGDNGTGLSTLYNGVGVKNNAIIVTIPPGGGAGAPTGVAFNGVAANFGGDNFLFATENGTLAGWRGALGATAETLFTKAGGADYTGLAIIGNKAYLANNAGGLDVYDHGTHALVGTFFDPTAPAGYAPFNVELINGKLYVTFSKTSGGVLGEGFIDIFDPTTNTFTRLIQNGGNLADPWGLALAPSTFGQFGGDLLVGNFADGKINAYDAAGLYVGTLKDQNGNDLVNESLWDIAFGNNGAGSNPNTLYLTAGLHNEEHGLFASVQFVPEPTSMMLLGSGMAGVLVRLKRRKS